MAKHKRNNKKNSNDNKLLTYVAWILSLIALLLSALLAGYYFGFADAQKKADVKEKVTKTEHLALLKKLGSSVKSKPKSVQKRLKEVLHKERKQYISAVHELDGKSLDTIEKVAPKRKTVVTKRPRLAIIIDDVGTKTQVEAIKSLHIPLTMSFLPPSKTRPNTPKLAKNENIYMVHLPMEAMHWSAEEPSTLRISDSQSVISARIKEIKKLFPKVHYINNHTGSKFTSNEVAMNRLIFALNSKHIHFIDSRTTAQTQAPKVMQSFGLKYVYRDVFLDHHMDKTYVLGQIKKAIEVAKNKGTAIAIGHPHKNTLQALYESKELLKNVELVYINRL